MAEEDLQQFLQKVKALNALVASLEQDPARRSQLAACSDHNAVVTLAGSWGFEIGRRWGEHSVASSSHSMDTHIFWRRRLSAWAGAGRCSLLRLWLVACEDSLQRF